MDAVPDDDGALALPGAAIAGDGVAVFFGDGFETEEFTGDITGVLKNVFVPGGFCAKMLPPPIVSFAVLLLHRVALQFEKLCPVTAPT